MFKFYWANLKYSIKLGWYQYVGYIVLGFILLLVFFLVAIGCAHLLDVKIDILKALVTSLLLSPAIVVFFLCMLLVSKGLYITFYSLQVQVKELFAGISIWYKIHKFFTSPKKLLALVLFPLITLGAGFAISPKLLKTPFEPVGIIVALIIYIMIVLLLGTRRFMFHLMGSSWNFFSGIFEKSSFIGFVVVSQLLLFVCIYNVVLLIISA